MFVTNFMIFIEHFKYKVFKVIEAKERENLEVSGIFKKSEAPDSEFLTV